MGLGNRHRNRRHLQAVRDPLAQHRQQRLDNRTEEEKVNERGPPKTSRTIRDWSGADQRQKWDRQTWSIRAARAEEGSDLGISSIDIFEKSDTESSTITTAARPDWWIARTMSARHQDW